MSHLDDAGHECDCDEQECGYIGEDDDPVCPECEANGDDLKLVHGDHGYRCTCGATFTIP